jgi:hypothetical protein
MNTRPDRTPGRTATAAAWTGPVPASTKAGLQRTALRHARSVTVWLTVALASAALTIATLMAVQSDPVVIGVPASASDVDADTTQMARAPTASRDIEPRRFYDATSSLEGTADGSGSQRTDPACQRG